MVVVVKLVELKPIAQGVVGAVAPFTRVRFTPVVFGATLLYVPACAFVNTYNCALEKKDINVIIKINDKAFCIN